MSFIRNKWYVAAWDGEVGNAPISRKICGEPIVLYRKLDGSVVALRDACPHRLLPLSMVYVRVIIYAASTTASSSRPTASPARCR